jgi:hypothetical protein
MNHLKGVALATFLFISVCPLTAQKQVITKDTICPTWYYNKDIVPEYFEPGFHTAIFGDRVNIRESPSKTAAILEVLPIGQPVEVIAFDSTRLTINGRTACWHLIAWSDAAKQKKQGWVWGGYLSLAGGGCLNQVTFLVGCTEVKKSKQGRWNLFIHEIKAVKDFQLSDKIKLPEVHLGEGQDFRLGIHSSKGVPGVQHVVQFEWYGAICGGLHENFYALWTKDGHFQMLPPLKSMGESGYYTDIEEYIFPDETDEIQYTYPLMYLLDKPENQGAILYLKENGGGDEEGASVSISITKLKFLNNVWRK